MNRTVGDHIAGELEALGVRRLYGESLGSSTVLPTRSTPDADIALLLADCDGRISTGWGAALVPGGVLHVSSQPGGRCRPVRCADLATVVATLRGVPEGPGGGRSSIPSSFALHLDLDLDSPADPPPPDPSPAFGVIGRQMTLSPDFAGARVAVLVGPGVPRSGHLDGLREMARTGGFAVHNSWGAKGVFRWDDPFHGGTFGLQELDATLAGFPDADIVVVSGLDVVETPLDSIGSHVVQEVPAAHLGALVERWPSAERPPTSRSPLYLTLAAVVTPLYESTGKLNAARASLHCSGACPDDGIVVGDAGVAGFWLARTFPTGICGSVVVPAARQDGFAVGAALVAGLDAKPCLAVADDDGSGSLDAVSEAILDTARSWGVPINAQLWGSSTRPLSPDEHSQLTVGGFGRDGVHVERVGVDASAISALTDVAGPIVAWGGV